jgi:hypothetical protein
MTFTLANIRCACGSSDIVLVEPGQDEQRAPGNILVQRGREPTGTCLRCWPALLHHQ